MTASLIKLGLTDFFTQQLNANEVNTTQFARIIEVQRSHLVASNGEKQFQVILGGAWFKGTAESRPTVGDWVLLSSSGDRIIRLLDRKSVFKRIAVGEKVGVQLIAANIDTLFIVTSCNDDFSESRLERYLSLAHEAKVTPVIVLTKADLAQNPDVFLDRVKELNPDLLVDVVNALNPDSLQGLLQWVTQGSTVALVGSSGVGKSSIVNSLSESELMETGAIREHDAKGRHTTSFRSLHCLPQGGILLDVPGMREIKVAEIESSLGEIFDDIELITSKCKFNDCAHNKEPGCAVRNALEEGSLDKRRYENYLKLTQEEEKHTATLVKQKKQGRKFSKTVKQQLAIKKGKKKG